MKDYFIFDNFIPESYQDLIETMLRSISFPWFYSQSTVGNSEDTFQFTHAFYTSQNTSLYWSEVRPFFYFLEIHAGVTPSDVFRCKANLLFPSNSSRKHHTFHQDHEHSDFWSLLYYVNNTDGETYLKSEGETTKISPKRGRALLFRSNIYHTSSSPVNFKDRMVINLIFR